MNRTLVRIALFVFALTLTLSISAFAGSKSENITLYHDAQLNGTTLPAGDYTVKCTPNGSAMQVRFLKNGKEVATATGQAKHLSSPIHHDQVVLESGNGGAWISELDISSSNTAVSFDSSMANAGK